MKFSRPIIVCVFLYASHIHIPPLLHAASVLIPTEQNHPSQMQSCLVVPHFPILRFPFPHFQRPRRIGRGRKYGRRRHKRRKWKVGVVVERVSATANLPAETCPDDVVAACSPCRQLDWGLSHRTFVYSIACLPTILCPMFVRFSRLHPDPGHVAPAAAPKCHIVDSDILHARMSETYLDGHQPKHVSCLVRSSVRM